MELLAGHPEGLSTPRLLELLGDVHSDSHVGALTKVGQALRSQKRAGRVRQAGQVPGAWQRGPAVIWQITDVGRAWLAYRKLEAEAAPAAVQAADRAAAARAQEKQQDRKRRAALLAGAAASYSRETPTWERRQVVPTLRAEGCTLQEIADVFGLTREMIRQDLQAVWGG